MKIYNRKSLDCLGNKMFDFNLKMEIEEDGAMFIAAIQNLQTQYEDAYEDAYEYAHGDLLDSKTRLVFDMIADRFVQLEKEWEKLESFEWTLI